MVGCVSRSTGSELRHRNRKPQTQVIWNPKSYGTHTTRTESPTGTKSHQQIKSPTDQVTNCTCNDSFPPHSRVSSRPGEDGPTIGQLLEKSPAESPAVASREKPAEKKKQSRHRALFIPKEGKETLEVSLERTWSHDQRLIGSGVGYAKGSSILNFHYHLQACGMHGSGTDWTEYLLILALNFTKINNLPKGMLLPTLEEYAYLVGIPILDQVSFNGLENIPTSQEITDMLHIDESLVSTHMTTKGGIQGLPSKFLIAQATMHGKAMSEDAFEAIFVLLIYGLVLFPNIDKFVEVNAIRIFSTLNLVSTLLGDTYFSLHMRNAKGGGAIVCCLPLLYKWFISHLPRTVTFKENKGCLRWSTRLMSLTNDDISWYNRVYDGVQIIDSCGEFSNVPLLGTCGGINYNPVLARRQLGFPLKDKPNNILLEGVFF
ncbi:hypothetical protein KIW84_033523 [Lathyrus oleraceus]|uniref:DUF7745 domain-containing protein n=1 Tax=Pisum sativum TaxID=3888 RepID=A0A9D4Y0C7_PEA|nr:hypothetical protein KIW84_033523 [Pisum sativum]